MVGNVLHDSAKVLSILWRPPLLNQPAEEGTQARRKHSCKAPGVSQYTTRWRWSAGFPIKSYLKQKDLEERKFFQIFFLLIVEVLPLLVDVLTGGLRPGP